MNDLTPRLQSLFTKTRAVCFGRFLIHIPATATVIYGPSDVEATLLFYEGEAENINQHLAHRLAEIETEREFFLKSDVPRLPLFGRIIDGAMPGQKITFGSKDRIGYAMHSFIPVGKDLFIQHLDTVLPEYDEVPMFNRVASKLRSRLPDEIPAEPGICIEGGFIPLVTEYEWIRIAIRLKEFPDIHLSIDAHKNLDRLNTDASPILLRSQAKEFAEADGLGAVFVRTKILRQHARQLNGWSGEELALRTPAYKEDKSVHEFRFHSVGAVRDALHPELDVRFDTGVDGNRKGGVNPSLTDEEALALWDKLINTIRVRQPSDATSTKTRQVPIASQVATGDSCPQTGWWESQERRKIEGDRRRLLTAGDVMPPVLLGDHGLWQKLTGNRSSQQTATVWTLVSYENKGESLSNDG